MANLNARCDAQHHFRWLDMGRIPPAFDLRHHGWTLEEHGEPCCECIGLIHAGKVDSEDWQRAMGLPVEMRRFILVAGTTSASERIRLLNAGFGEAVSAAIEADELEARADRLAQLTRWLPRHRRIGDLELDLLAREAFGSGKALNLNPREFALIWRLADVPGEPVSKQDLIHDVWRMGFVPETNSIAVHMSRLRRKLGFVGLSGIIATASAGGYCLIPPDARSGGLNAFPNRLASTGPALAAL